MAHRITHFTSRLALVTACCAVFTASRSAVAQQGPPLPAPSPEHEILKKEVGTWDGTMHVWPAPGAPPITAQATDTIQLLGNDMWVVSRFEMNFGGIQFVASGSLGYDPTEKKYIGTWVDGISPYLTISKGDYDAASKTITMLAETRDAMTGKPIVQKQITHYLDDDTRLYELQQKGDDGKFWKMIEIKFTRRADNE